MDITAFIRELLFSHDCVVVPGFGGFIGNYTPASIDKETSTFSPPVKRISFNRNLNHNDGLLVGRISGHLNINYGDARNIVEEFTVSVRKKLGKGEKVVFENIGSFINNQEGNVQFEPDRNVNYHLDSYGLESFQFPPVEGYDVRRRITRHLDKEPAKRLSVRKTLWRAAVIIPLLALLVAVPLKTDIFKQKIDATTLNPLAAAEFESIRKAVDKDSSTELISSENKALTTPDITVREDVSTPADMAALIPPAEESYLIITGSFRSEANAELQAGYLKAEGFTPEIISAPNGFYRVSAMRCSDMVLATSRRDSIMKKYPEAWISRNKRK